jgi:isoamylase
VLHVRERVARNFLATLAFSQGVPMVSHGDELGRTQLGNNNAYCHDSELTWISWELGPEQRDRLAFARRVFEIRHRYAVFRRRRYFGGRIVDTSGEKDVMWVRPDGGEMTDADWGNPRTLVLGMLIHPDAGGAPAERGRSAEGDSMLLILNGGGRGKEFVLPRLAGPGTWIEEVNTGHAGSRVVRSHAVTAVAHSLILLRHAREP